MFKITFEKVIVFVLILILFISSGNIFSQYFKLWFPNNKNKVMDSGSPKIQSKASFSAIVNSANDLYRAGEYEKALEKYNELLLLSILTDKQKQDAIFKQGMCYYKLGNFEKAQKSFIYVTEYNSNDVVAYNNAAVCAYFIGDKEKALEYLQKSIDTIPVLEYFYNMGRVHESMGHYEDAATYLMAVVKGEDNITASDKIDPVRVKNKVQNLIPEADKIASLASQILSVLKYKDDRELLVIDDTDMELKNTDFILNTETTNGLTQITGSFDREKSDPYNLINQLTWSVVKDGKTIFTMKDSKFAYKTKNPGKYEIFLSISYNRSEVISNSKVVSIKNEEKKTDVVVSETPVVTPTKTTTKLYAADYTQLFEKDFILSSGKGYVDGYNVVWGRDNVDTKIITEQYRDSGSCLLITNISSGQSGIWANLTSLIDGSDFRGKKISIRFQSRKITDKPNLTVTVRAGSEHAYSAFNIDKRWSMQSINIFVPEDATALTLSMEINPGEEIEIDGFNIVVVNK